MRIIAGSAGRMAIKVPHAVARPTTDFVRQAMFSILGNFIHDARVLDLFAGSGALGLEALSRGAASCIFVEESSHASRVIQQNLLTTKLLNGRVVQDECVHFLNRDLGLYDLVFADPPYAKNPLDTEMINRIFQLGVLHPRVKADGIFYAEVAKQTTSPQHQDWELVDRRHYGSSAILLYRPAGNKVCLI